MSEYTRKEDAIQAIMGHFLPQTYCGEEVEHAKNLAESIINGVPTEEIVRCKDCKHVEYTPASSWARPYACRITSKGLGYCPDDGNGFCPYGERKEDKEE